MCLPGVDVQQMFSNLLPPPSLPERYLLSTSCVLDSELGAGGTMIPALRGAYVLVGETNFKKNK